MRIATAFAMLVALLGSVVPLAPVARGAVILLVETTSDAEFPADGLCSLRAAILAANSGGFAGYCFAGSNEEDSIRFSLGAGVPVINVGAANLPTITQGVSIIGNTGGATRVRIHGPGTGNGTGLINSGTGTYIRNLEIDGFAFGIFNSASDVTIAGNVIGPNDLYGVYSDGASLTVGGTTGVTSGGPCTGACNVISGHGQQALAMDGSGTIQGNFIGLNAAGTAAEPNQDAGGVSGSWTIGGTEPGAGNVVSGNTRNGLSVSNCDSCVVEGNRFGTNAAGTAAVPNGSLGLFVSASNGIRVGGSAIGSGNLISGNGGVGLEITQMSGAIVQGNRVGVSATGGALGNGSAGISIGGGNLQLDGALIGSATDPAAANVVAHNGGAGILVTGPANTGPVHHVEIRGNSIYSNAGPGIDHEGTVNDGIGAPTIASIGPLSGTACANCLVDVYSDDHDEGRTYDGSVTADLGGNWTFTGFVGPNVTATATDGAHNTSAMSGPITISSPFTDIATSGFDDEIEWLYANGITTGCRATKFCPRGSVTREQMASFLARMFRLPTTATDFFTDDESSTHESNINRLAAAGITTGCGATTFCPKDLVSRAEMASFIARAAGLTAGAGRNYFNDDDASSHEPNIDRIAAAGITTGCGTFKYCPSNSVTREQMAAFLYRILVPAASPPYPAPG